MKTFAAFLALVVISQALHTLPTERRIKYEYKGYTVSGIPLISNERTGLAIWADLTLDYKTIEHLTQKIVFKMDKIVLRQLDMDSDDLLRVTHVPALEEILTNDMFKELPMEIATEILRQLERPIMVTMDLTTANVHDFMATSDEFEYILNIKKAIIEQFFFPVFEQKIVKDENTVLGECRVNYDLMEDIHGHYLITKQFSGAECLRPVNFTDLIGSKMIPIERETQFTHSSVFTHANTTLKNQKFIVNSLVTEGRYTIAPFTPENGEATTFTRQEFTLTKEDELSLNVDANLVKRADNLLPVFEHNEKTFTDIYMELLTEDEKVEMITNIIIKVFKAFESTTNPTFDVEKSHEFLHVVKIMRGLRKSLSFKTIIQFIERQKSDNIRPMTISAMSFCGSPALVEALPTIKDHLTTPEINMIITKLPMTIVPTKTTLTTLKTLYKSLSTDSTLRQVLLTLGSEIHEMCKTRRVGQIVPKETCTDEIKKEFIQFFTEEYLEADSTKRLVVLKSIGNSGLPMTALLSQIVHSTEHTTHLRLTALLALRRMENVDEVTKILMPVYRNEFEIYPVELRIGAFQLLINKVPTGDMLTKLVGLLNIEKDMQIGNFVHTYLESLINLPTVFTPTVELSVAAQTLLPTIRHFEDDMWYSKNMQHFIAAVAHRMGFLLKNNVAFNHEQALPSAGYLNIAQSISGYYINLLEAGFETEGMDKIVREFILNWFNPETTIDNEMINPKFRREMNLIHSMLTEKITTKDLPETSVQIFFRHLGDEIGLFTLEDLSEFDFLNTLLTWDASVKYFNIMPIISATMKIQTPFGVPMIADWSSLFALSIHSNVIEPLTEDTIFHRTITPRFMNAVLGRFGVDLGLFKTTIGQCMHLKTITPLTASLKFNPDTEVPEFEVYVNTADKLYTVGNLENLRLVELESVPCKHVEYINKDKLLIVIRRQAVILSPLMLNNQVDYEMFGLRFTLQSPVDQWTFKRPLIPYIGHLKYNIGFINKPTPIGFKVILEKDFTTTFKKFDVTFFLNPRVPDLTMRLDFATRINLDLEDKKTPLFTFHTTFDEQDTYSVFFNTEIVQGTFRCLFNWIEAGDESNLIELSTIMQMGWGIDYTPKKHDLVIKTILSKSELQKMFEMTDLTLEDTSCYQCEKDILKGTFTTLSCVKCIPRRALLFKIENEYYVNTEKFNILYPMYPTTNMDEHRDTINKQMTHVNTDDVMVMKNIIEVHPMATTMNITVITEHNTIIYPDVPVFPAFRRMYNLPESRLTDTVLERFPMNFRAKCILDSFTKVKTFDDFVFELTKTTNCEQLLVRDIVANDLEITTKFTSDNRRVVTITMPGNVVEMEQTTTGDKYRVLVNKVEKKFTKDTKDKELRIIQTPLVDLMLTKLTTPFATEKTIVAELKNKYITVTLVKDLVHVQVPFWHKSGVVGLCGDFNFEPVGELVLPDLTVAPTLERFIRSYTVC